MPPENICYTVKQMKETFLLRAAIVVSPLSGRGAEASKMGCAWLVAWQVNYLEITCISHSIPFLSFEVSQSSSLTWFYFSASVVLLSTWLNCLASCGSWRPRVRLAPLGACPLTRQHFSDVLSFTELSAARYFSLHTFAFFLIGTSFLTRLFAPRCFWCLRRLPI